MHGEMFQTNRQGGSVAANGVKFTLHLGALALVATAIAGCLVQSAPPSAEPPVIIREVPVEEPAPRSVVLDDGSYVELVPGEEVGMFHCCGDAIFKLEIDCNYNQLRCYERKRGGWKYTYGRLCKEALGPSCYLNGCDNVCEAVRTFQPPP